MNDFSDIEAELKKLRIAPVRAELVARIADALAQTPSAGVTQRRKTALWGWLSLGLGGGLATAAILIMAARSDNSPTSPSSRRMAVAPATASAPFISRARNGSGFLPAGFTEVVYRTSNEGLQFPAAAAAPMRRMRYETRETLRWRDPRTGASLRVSYPSEEVVLTPIDAQ